MRKYESTKHEASSFADYSNDQILKMIDSVQGNSLERKDLVALVRELAYRNQYLEKSLDRF
jgi:hypothetical protein